MKIDINMAELIKPIIREVTFVAKFQAKREVYPKEIQGNALASKLLEISRDALKQRVSRGFYKQGYHFTKKSDRIYLWNRDALLEDEIGKSNESKAIY